MSAAQARQVFLACRKLSTRLFSASAVANGNRNAPLCGNEVPRSGGIASMMRLPVQENTDGKLVSGKYTETQTVSW